MAVLDSTKSLVRTRANGLCEYCHANEQWQFVRFTMDHIVPQSLGGSDDGDNLALACRNCNERRGNRFEIEIDGQIVRLFNPRADTWNDHFAWDQELTRIVATSAIGAATVQILDMNDDRHGEKVVRIRQRDRDDGYHPPEDDARENEG